MSRDPHACGADLRRRALFEQRAQFNGIDFVELGDDQLSLCVHFFGPVPVVDASQMRISGGSRITGIQVTAVRIERAHSVHHDDCLHLTLDRAGDFSTYTVSIEARDGVPALDRRYTSANFSFKVACPRQLDCLHAAQCESDTDPGPNLDYMAKDYASFRQLILDRMALTMPGWQERHAADPGIALVELLAYAADHLSYYQDAVATEAYLDTARQRISVRRHVRLVDYFMHEGLNARAWVSVATSADTPPVRADEVYFITGFEGIESASGGLVMPADLVDIPAGSYEVFEPVGQDELRFYAAHSEMHFHTWGDADCCLAQGATSATLLNPEGVLQLKVGDVLIFEEVVGPRTGNPADADPSHRHAVRLTNVTPARDPLLGIDQLLDIEWDSGDALPFALCLSARLASPGCERINKLSVARGNVVLVDHGRSVCDTDPVVAGGDMMDGDCACEGSMTNATAVPVALQFALRQAPLVFADPAPLQGAAAAVQQRDEYLGRPAIWLAGTPAPGVIPVLMGDPRFLWEARPDLLSSGPRDQHFVAEMDDAGFAHVRFGDGKLGLQPAPGTAFCAAYRIGGGAAGNAGRDAIAYMVLREQTWSGITVNPRNPIAARGGMAPETTAEARLRAPHAFRSKLQRAITPEDYAAIAGRHAGLQRAAARLRWTGSWYEMRVAADALGTSQPPAGLLQSVEESLAAYRRIGHDLDVVAAVYVPLDLELKVCVDDHAIALDVKAALIQTLGGQGLFHPDRLSFGGGIYLSQLVAAAQAVEGVASVDVVRLQRLGHAANNEIENGVLPIGAMEIAQLDNDPNFPERGRLIINTGGGR